jgi:H+/Cl- antiporter ClcA
MLTAALLTGVAAGAAGVLLTLLLHLVQHLAFGYTEASFLVGVLRASPQRRVLALAIGGLIVGTLWWALRRWSRPVPSVEQVLEDGSGRPPTPTVTADAVLQIMAVGFGASLGREGAPGRSAERSVAGSPNG